MRSLSKRLFVKILLFPILLSLTGCVYLIVGGVGAVGGYVVSPDTVEGITEYEAMTVWDASAEIISIMGEVGEENEEGGIIMGKVYGAKVTITVVSINESMAKIRVKARKAYLPKISIAQKVYLNIMDRLANN